MMMMMMMQMMTQSMGGNADNFGGGDEPAWKRARMMDQGKMELVNQVKAWQKQSQSHKESWYRFVKDNSPNGQLVFDPARHEVDFLSWFVQSTQSGQVQLMQPTGEFGAGGGMGKG